MSDVSLETVAGKLNRTGYDAFMKAHRHARSEGNRNVELAHWFYHIVANDKSDVSVALQNYGLDRSKVLGELQKKVDDYRKNVTEMPGFAEGVIDALDRGWHYATLLFAEPQIRTGHLLIACLKSKELLRALKECSPTLGGLNVDTMANDARSVWALSEEEDQRPMDGSGLSSGSGGGGAGGDTAAKGTGALDRYCVDLTAQAASGKMDPIVGRDDEIRNIIDVLMRRRQNNPILTGEAGVGKTAVVEGFAQRLAAGDVPPQLQGNRLMSLDMGLMQAGASMKGEFEQRLRQLIDEVQGSATPIILFIDETHTLIGAGGAAGTGDAANLMKPALARGTLRTIGATTWMEYQKYFEKDPALTRRFQPITVDEPDIERACYMLRGIMKPMEAHHRVRISDEAIVAAVQLSSRYIPARQLPDKAVSLLDTASARVAISQSTTPAMIADFKSAIARLEAELLGKERQAELGETNAERIEEIRQELVEAEKDLAAAEAKYAEEKAVVQEVLELRAKLTGEGSGKLPVDEPGEMPPSPEQAAAAQEAAAEAEGDGTGEDASPEAIDAAVELSAPATGDDAARLREALAAKVAELEARDADDRMIYAHVDYQAVASVVGDWTGIPVGRMVSDELQAILSLADRLKERVVGQDHGLEMIAKRIETSTAKLDNPGKPIGVFMLAGPSGVGKTETALALAEAIYGGEQNVITIAMSEYQEAHTVALLKGAPPGYVGYGEGGRLTEAVRRKPYSVVLLDEVEKAHPDVHELFFQVFDKGHMEDGSGRSIDFKNTLILLTSNAGTDVIMDMCAQGEARPDAEALAEALRPSLLEHFPPALIGRIVTIPYYPLGGDVLAMITRLKLDAIVKRVKQNHNARMELSDGVIDHIVSQCNDPDSGGRMIDNIITNSILPELSRAILEKAVGGEELSAVKVDVKDAAFTYELA